MKNVEFKDMTVKEAIRDLEMIFKIDNSWKASLQKHMNDPLSYLPFESIDDISDFVADALTTYWIADMSKFDKAWRNFYRNYCDENGIEWKKFFKSFPNGKKYTAFARSHIGEIAMLYGFYNSCEDEEDIYNMQDWLIPYLSEYYGYGRHPFDDDKSFCDAKEEILKLIETVEKDEEETGRRIVF